MKLKFSMLTADCCIVRSGLALQCFSFMCEWLLMHAYISKKMLLEGYLLLSVLLLLRYESYEVK